MSSTQPQPPRQQGASADHAVRAEKKVMVNGPPGTGVHGARARRGALRSTRTERITAAARSTHAGAPGDDRR